MRKASVKIVKKPAAKKVLKGSVVQKSSSTKKARFACYSAGR